MDFLSCDGLPTGNISGFYGTRQAAWTQSPEGLASVAKPDILLSWLLPIRCAEVRWAPSGKTQVTGLARTSRARRLAAPGGRGGTRLIRHGNDPPLGSEPADREPALRALLADCTPVTGRDLQRYALRPEARREAIARLGNRDGIQAALNANPIDAGDLMQRSFAACLRGELAPLRQDWPLWRTSSWGAGLLRRLYKFH